MDGAAVHRALDLVTMLHSSALAGSERNSGHDRARNGVEKPGNVGEGARSWRLLEGVNRTLDTYSPEIYSQNLDAISASLSPARKGKLAAAWALCFNAEFRDVRRTLLDLRKGKPPSSLC